MPFSSTMNSDLHSAAMPRELGHFHAVSRQNCTEVTVLAHTSVILSAGTTHTSCSGRGQKPHYVTLYAQGMKSFSVLQRGAVYVPRKWDLSLSSLVCTATNVTMGHKITHFQLQCSSQKKKKKTSNISKQTQPCLYGCSYTLNISNRQHSLLSSMLLQKPGYKLGNLEISNPYIRQSATGRHEMQVTGFPHILSYIQSSKNGWELQREDTINDHSYHLYTMAPPEIPMFYKI